MNVGFTYPRLPKLLYVGDVPVETTAFGAAQLYRLLSLYPPGDLLILEANPWRSKPHRRLTAVRYGTFPLGNPRLLNSRFHTLYGSLLLEKIPSRSRAIERLIRPFVPEAVLSVTHGYSWIAGAEYALRNRLPLHLILHDDWPGRGLVYRGFRYAALRFLERYYQRATSRLCISPMMAETYQREFSEPATVVLPCSPPDAIAFEAPPERLSANRSCLAVGYGGTLNNGGQVQALLLVAEALAQCRGKLIIYGPIDRQQRDALDLARPNIEFHGMLSSEGMVNAFRASVDALLVPLSFLELDRRQNLLAFPSKLADYTAVGLPLLIFAPPSSGLVHWAEEVGGFAEIVIDPNSTALSAALNRLASSPQHRLSLGARALHIHQACFSHATAWMSFCNALDQDLSIASIGRAASARRPAHGGFGHSALSD